MTRHEFIDLVQSTRSNRKLAERLEELGVNENLSHFVRANTAFNDGGFEQVFKECDIDLLIAELRDIPGWFRSSSRLIRSLTEARESLKLTAILAESTPAKLRAQKTLARASKRWRRTRMDVLGALYGGVRRAPDRFYDRSAAQLENVHFAVGPDSSTQVSRRKSPLLLVQNYYSSYLVYYAIFFVALASKDAFRTAVYGTDPKTFAGYVASSAYVVGIALVGSYISGYWKLQGELRDFNSIY